MRGAMGKAMSGFASEDAREDGGPLGTSRVDTTRAAVLRSRRAMQRPPWRILGDSSEIVLATPIDGGLVGAARLDPREAELQLRRLIGPSWRGAASSGPIVDAARYVRAHHALRLGALTDDPRRVVTEALARGLLVAWRVEVRRRAAGGGAGETADGQEIVPAGELLRKTWIELELTDMDGNAMRGERYWIKLPDGTVREGLLDEHGRAYFGDLDPGTAEIRWPDRDGEATDPAMPLGQRAIEESAAGTTAGSRAAPRERTWVEIELLDMADQPVAYERYWIRLPDGTVREGALDAMGLAYFDDLDPGQCTIRWLGRDEEAAFLEPDATAPGATDRVAAQVETLVSAAREGAPFCEECERARRQQEAAA